MQKMYMTLFLGLLLAVPMANAQNSTKIYKKGWIDFNKNGQKDIYEDPEQTVEARVADLLSQMTLDEKTAQMATLYGYKRVLQDALPTSEWKQEVWKDGIGNIDEHLNGLAYHPQAQTPYSYPFSKHAEAINTVQHWFVEQTRLGVPVDFSNEGIHGLNHDRATPLPAPIAIGSTWDQELVYRAGEMVGREGKALGYTNIYAPILDVSRDPRWGRIVETYGEDPYLIARLGVNMAEGIQSNGIAATIKHFAAYSVPSGGRDGNARTDPHIAPRELHQLYLYPFKKAVQEAKVMGVMSSYNDWNGVPVTGSHYFLTELLREQYGFDGYVVSDSHAVAYLYDKHHVAADYPEAVRQAVEAGLDVRTNFNPPENYILPLRQLVKDGKLSMATINDRVSHILKVKFRLGLFDQPYVADTKAADKLVNTPADKELIHQMSAESLVLLKNEGGLLPLDKKKIKKILVTGPLATQTNHSISRYGPSNIKVITSLEGIQNYVGKEVEVTYAKGCNTIDPNWPESEILPEPLSAEEQQEMDAAVAAAKDVDVIVAVLGENEKLVGESLSRTSLALPGRQEQLLEALYATGKPVVLVLINGRPLTINWANKYVPAIVETWFPGAPAGQVLAETLFGDINPSGKLPVTFPKTVGQIEFAFPHKPAAHADQPKSGPNGAGNTRVNGSIYPFGHGLSYTSFSYQNLKVDPVQQGKEGDVHVSVEVTNTGDRAGDEVVQLYVKDLVSSVTTYEMQLRGFQRVSLKPGETKTASFVLHPDDLQLLDKDMHWVVEPGDFEVLVGSSSEDIRQQASFTIH